MTTRLEVPHIAVVAVRAGIMHIRISCSVMSVMLYFARHISIVVNFSTKLLTIISNVIAT